MEYIIKLTQIAETVISWLFIIWVAMFFILGGKVNIEMNGIKPTIDAIKELLCK